MSTTNLTDLQYQIQTKWSPVGMAELREKYMLQSLVSKQYEGEMRFLGDIVRVYQVNAPSSDFKTIGTDHDSFTANKLSMSYVDLKADKRAVSAMKFDDLDDIQTIVEPNKNPQVRQAMIHDVAGQINTYLYSLMVPSTSAPDHTIGSVTTLAETNMALMREDSSLAHWGDEPRYCLTSPQYYSDLLATAGLNSSDYGFNDAARINGKLGLRRYGFDVFEDDSVTAASLISFIPSALLYAAQYELRWKISDLHAVGEFGYQLSCDIVFGAKLSIDGADKCYKITAAA